MTIMMEVGFERRVPLRLNQTFDEGVLMVTVSRGQS